MKYVIINNGKVISVLDESDSRYSEILNSTAMQYYTQVDMSDEFYNKFKEGKTVNYTNGTLSVVDDSVDIAKKAKIAEIESYDSSPSVNAFTVNGTSLWLDKDTRVGLMLRFNAEKAAGKTTTTLWFGTMSITGNTDSLIQMMYALEVYASACYDNTAQHKASVYALNIVSEIENYDFTAGYPAMLRFNL